MFHTGVPPSTGAALLPPPPASLCVVDADGHAAALFDTLDLPVAERRVQARAVQAQRHRGDPVWPAEGAGLEGGSMRGLLAPLAMLARAGCRRGGGGGRVDVARDVEGVALAVAEAVDHRAAHAALLADRLPQRLRLAPVAAQVLPLFDYTCTSL